MAKSEKLSASLEDYLEAIHQIIAEKGAVRAKDVAERLGVAAPSVTNALQSLTKKNLVTHAPYDVITLTKKGAKHARNVVHKHAVLKEFFVKVLAVDVILADTCACQMEHAVPDEVLERFIEFLKFEERCHIGGTEWIDGHGFVCHAHASNETL